MRRGGLFVLLLSLLSAPVVAIAEDCCGVEEVGEREDCGDCPVILCVAAADELSLPAKFCVAPPAGFFAIGPAASSSAAMRPSPKARAEFALFGMSPPLRR